MQHPKPIARGLVLRAALAWSAALAVCTAPAPARAAARPEPPFQHYVPADKKLDPAWVKGLLEKGTTAVWRGKELDGIGMPCGGICAGQLYLRGDGTLAYWRIFNRKHNTGYGDKCYRRPVPPSQVGQGFLVAVESGGKTAAKRLSKADFPDIEFVGEYPIGIVRYQAKGFPVRVRMEAFSPFIPLNAKDSALPCTLFHLTLKNTSAKPIAVRTVGWLENAVLFHSAPSVRALRRTRLVQDAARSVLVHTVEQAPPPKPGTADRPAIVLADFEGPDYGDWKVAGKAFGTRPAKGTLPEQQRVSGFLGKGLVNTYLGKDGPQGTLTSPPFAVSRKFIQFLIGGGNHAGRTCVNLLVDGKTVRTAHGRSNERLLRHFWSVEPFAGKQAQIQIVDRASGAWGHINIDQIELTDKPRAAPAGPIDRLPDHGSMALALAGPAAPADETTRLLAAIGPAAKGLQAISGQPYPAGEKRSWALASPAAPLAPGAEHTVTFALAWHFTNQDGHGRRYGTWFKNAQDAADYALKHHDRLAADTRLWHDTYYDSTLPHWLLDRLHYTVSNLATGTVQWWASGRFWAWEGVGCCAGTCTHVWNYAHAHARLFPQLARSAREMQDFGAGFQPSGLVGFRSNRAYAADGQCGTILKAYREHLMSADGAFLKRNYPRIKKALQYSIGRDIAGNGKPTGKPDGIIEDSQHNTFDINFHGPNTFVGSLYLAALRAGEEMATEMGDADFAAECRRILEDGSRLTVEKLWDGEYFVQDVDLKRFPKHQYGRGCLSDQLFGQGWAHQLALGYIYPQANVKKTLQSIWKYNWAPDVGPQNAVHPPRRWFARPGEPGLFTCTWPKSKHLERNAVFYKNEIWTGIEYQAAGHMIWEGMLTEGLAIIRGIHDRYQPLNHNPYNEVECGDHYARALASWGAYIALAGHEYHGPKGHIAFAPRISPDAFRAAFTAAEGWGTFAQKRQGTRQESQIALRWGTLRLTRLTLALPDAARQPTLMEATLDGRPIKASPTVADGKLQLDFAAPVTLTKGQTLQITATW